MGRSARRFERLVAVAALLALLGGCFGVGTAITSSSSSCTNLPVGACDEQVQRFSDRFPQAVSIDIECRVAECTRAAGAGTVVIKLPDGTTRNDTFTYAGDPQPAPEPICQAIAADACRRIALGVWDDQPPSRTVTVITVACTTLPCTDEKGEAEITVTFADGGTTSTSWGWEGAE